MEQITTWLGAHNALSSFGSIAGIGAALVLLGSCWRYVVQFFEAMRNLILVRSMYKQEASSAMLSYIFAHAKKFKFGIRAYAGTKHFVNKVQRLESICYEDITNEPTFIWLAGRPLIIKRGDDKNQVKTNEVTSYYDESPDSNEITITTFRGLINLDVLLLKAVEYYNSLYRVADKKDTTNHRFLVKRLGGRASMDSQHGATPGRNRKTLSTVIETCLRTKQLRLLGWNIEDIGQKMGNNCAFNVFFYPPNIMKLVDEIKAWVKYEKWFKEKGIPWRLGCLFHGKPGTGKSTLIRSIAMELDLPVFILDLSTLDNSSLGDAWEEAQQSAPAIVLIEDIDSVFNGRENIANTNVMKDQLTYDALLNTISGVKNSDGILLCVTTNDISKLDPAIGVPDANEISSRPGRIDRSVELIEMQEAERRKVAEYILKDCPDRIEEVIGLGQGETAAQFQARCTSIALSHFWKANTLG